MFVMNKRVVEIFAVLIFGFTAMSTLIGVENVAGGSVVKLGFPFVFYEQVCAGAQCTYATNPLMLIPNMLIYFGIAAGLVNFKELKKQKKLSASAPLLANKPKKPGIGLFKKKQKAAVPTFFDGKTDVKKPVEKEFEYNPGKYDIADEEPLFTKEELRDEEDGVSK